jgi:hypothetical protein
MLEESVSLDLLDPVVYTHGGASANDAVKVFAVPA